MYISYVFIGDRYYALNYRIPKIGIKTSYDWVSGYRTAGINYSNSTLAIL